MNSTVSIPPQLVASVDPDFLRGDIEDEDDGICTVCEGSSLVLQYEYHILYSCSYSAPVLYFRAFTLGQLHIGGSLHIHCLRLCYVAL